MEKPKNTTLELTLLFCSSLKAFNFFRKLSPYAAVSLVSDTGHRISDQRYKTETDKIRGCNPEWNHSFSLDIARPLSEQQDVFVKFEVCCEGGSILRNRKVGEVRVPLKTLVDEFDGVDRFLQYRVVGQSSNAVLNFSYKLNGILSSKTAAAPGGGEGTGHGNKRCKLRYFSSFGTQFSVENIGKHPTVEVPIPNGTRKVLRCHSADAGAALPSSVSIFSPVPYRHNSYVCPGGTVAAEIDEDDHPITEHVSESGQYPSGLQLTGYTYQYNRWAVNNTRL